MTHEKLTMKYGACEISLKPGDRLSVFEGGKFELTREDSAEPTFTENRVLLDDDRELTLCGPVEHSFEYTGDGNFLSTAEDK